MISVFQPMRGPSSLESFPTRKATSLRRRTAILLLHRSAGCSPEILPNRVEYIVVSVRRVEAACKIVILLAGPARTVGQNGWDEIIIHTSLRRGLEAAYSGVTLGDVAQRNFTLARENDIVFDIVQRMARHDASMAVVTKIGGRYRRQR